MAEVVGMVLGAVPVVATTIRQFSALHKLWARFKNYNEAVEELLTFLNCQKVIFVNETLLLLAAAVGPEEAKAMVNDLGHPSWTNPKTEARLGLVLEDSKETITMAAENLSDKLTEMEERIAVLDTRNGSDKINSKKWKKAIWRKFDFASSERKIKDHMESIARATECYRVLRTQRQDIVTCRVVENVDSCTLEGLERVKATQDAARHVYENLVSACRLHTEHHAQFGLQSTYNASVSGTEIKFQIAYRRLLPEEAEGSQEVLWFVVDAVMSNTVPSISEPLLSSMVSKPETSTQKRASSAAVTLQGTIALHSRKKRCTSLSPSQPGAALGSTPPPLIQSTAQSSDAALPDLGMTADLCNYLQACYTNNSESGSCIGWLGSSAQWKHKVYHSRGPPNSAAKVKRNEPTLAALLASLTPGQSVTPRPSVVQRLRLAKLLCIAMLNLHATPWIQSSWSSQNIILYDFQGASRISEASDTPYAFIEVPVGQSGNTADQHSPFDMLAPFIHNCTVFSLGVMLLELAFEKPLSEMCLPCDSITGLPPATTHLYAAFRQSKEVSAGLGVRYSEIVEKCLRCDFGQGSDLSNPALQSTIHREVVEVLDKLESGLRQLGNT